MKKTMKQLKAEQTAAEQAMGRKYNIRNAAVEYAANMSKQGIEVEAMFGNRFTPVEEWRVRVGEAILDMDEFQATLMLLGYIK